MQILLVEDDLRLGESIKKGLQEEAFTVTLVHDGAAARDLIQSQPWDLFILDVMLPDIGGKQLCELIRYKKIYTPVLMLSALSEPDDKILLLDTGADDYMVKPFHFKELVSRIKALHRRYHKEESTTMEVYHCDDLVLNISQHKVTRADVEITLSTKEFMLLYYLMKHQDTVVTRTSILNAVWDTNEDTYTNVIDVYISYLRAKLETGTSKKLIKTIKGRGYMLSEDS